MPDRGSATLLLPVGLLLMLTLGAIAVDLAHLHAARADLQRRADAAANDAATAGLDPDALRAGEGYRIDARRAQRAATRSGRVRPSGGLDHIAVDVGVLSPTAVEVEVAASVRLLFAPALPGAPRRVQLRATARATTELR